MTITRAELKQQAKEQMKGNLGMLILCTIIVGLISGACGMIPAVGTIASIIVAPPLSLGLIMVYLNVTYGDKADVGTVFDGFKTFGPSIVLNLLIGIFTFLWSLLFIIPGIIAAISYTLVYFIKLDNENLKTLEVIKESKKLMQGHKWEYFVLNLSFLGWILLGILTVGILYFWLIPYMSVTQANFYNYLKEKNCQ